MFNHWQITIRHLLRGSPFLFFSFFFFRQLRDRETLNEIPLHPFNQLLPRFLFLPPFLLLLSFGKLALVPISLSLEYLFFPFLSIVDDGVVTTSTKADKKARGNVFDISHGRIYREGCCRMRGNLRQEMFSDKKYFEVRNVC